MSAFFVIALVCTVVLPGCAAGQQALADASVSFEAASIKRNQSLRSSRAGLRILSGRLTIDNMPLRDVIEECYGLKGYQLIGAPGWLATDPYDIVAVASSVLPNAQMEAMLKRLLEERLHLRFHRAVEEVDGYALKVTKSGPKFRSHQAIAGQKEEIRERVQVGKFSSPAVRMQRLAGYVGIILQAPVIDRTNLDGVYEISLEYTRDINTQADAAFSPPALSTALQEQLGLRLVKQKVPVELFIIDHVERPSEN